MAGACISTERPIGSMMIVVFVSKVSQALSDGEQTNNNCCTKPAVVVGCLCYVLIAGTHSTVDIIV
jgi:hypothetical protein